jgi:hypothetical protein
VTLHQAVVILSLVVLQIVLHLQVSPKIKVNQERRLVYRSFNWTVRIEIKDYKIKYNFDFYLL